jgi:hypothetical protein
MLPCQVLFRNNFALSRDIMGMFQSFQSSSAVLDPSANPGLFQSKLVVIIKVHISDSDSVCSFRVLSSRMSLTMMQLKLPESMSVTKQLPVHSLIVLQISIKIPKTCGGRTGF